MINIQINDMTAIIAFWLAFSRFGAIIVQLPLFDNVAIPNIVKVLATFMITYAFYPYISDSLLADIRYSGVDGFWLLTIFNVIVGLVIGFLVKSIMALFISSGTLITQQAGFAALRYFDPNSVERVGPFEQLIQWTVLIILLTSGALLPMFKGAIGSFFSIHIFDLGKLASSPEFFLGLFKAIFTSSLMLASPLIFTNLLVMSVLGIIARTVPQMNVLMVSFVVNIGMGLLVFASCSDEFFQVALKLYTEKLGEWFQFVM